jgi:hypothetical protein
MASFNRGAAIFTSSSFVVESLEQRRHLAATLLSAYVPMIRSSSWEYQVIDNGRHQTRTDTLIGRMTRVHGQSAFKLVHKYSDRSDNYDLENLSQSGQIQWHLLGDVSFTPAMILPRLAKSGQHTHGEGAASVTAAFRPRGQYTVDFTVLKAERVQVPAGTFSCVKVRMNLDLNVGHHDAQDDISIHVVSSATIWWAKGIGMVKEAATAKAEATVNGDHQVSNSATTTTLSSYHIGQQR